MLKDIGQNQRVSLVLLHDLLAGALAWILAYLLRFNLELTENIQREILQTLLRIVPMQGLIFWRFGLYRGIWRYVSMPDLHRLFLAVLAATAGIVLLLWMLRLNVNVPRSVLIKIGRASCRER